VTGHRRVAYIDGLRAVAVLLVVAHHTVVASASTPRSFLENVLKHANHGVDLFFVLSGFCLSYPTISALRHQGTATFDAARYAAHRIVRIVPPYWIAYAVILVFFVTILKLGFSRPDAMPYYYSTWEFLKQVLFIDVHTQFLNGSFWTLPIEFRWYFVFPVLLYVWTRSPVWFVAIALAALCLSYAPSSLADVQALPAFMSGIVAAEICVRQPRLGAWPGVATVLLAAAAFLTTRSDGWHDAFNAAWYLCAFAFVVWAGSAAPLERVLSLRPVAVVGLASYSIYLVHQPVLAFLEEVGLNRWVAALIAVGVGFAFWGVAERPFMSKSAIRKDLLSGFQQFFDSCFTRIGLQRSVKLNDAA
jgi:exopolysaccharide production protein ExoZ